MFLFFSYLERIFTLTFHLLYVAPLSINKRPRNRNEHLARSFCSVTSRRSIRAIKSPSDEREIRAVIIIIATKTDFTLMLRNHVPRVQYLSRAASIICTLPAYNNSRTCSRTGDNTCGRWREEEEEERMREYTRARIFAHDTRMFRRFYARNVEFIYI